MEKKIKQSIEENIHRAINRQCKKYQFQRINPLLYQSLKQYSFRKGKRIRPLLFILSYKGYCGKNKKVSQSIYHVSTAIEFLHNFMLIHDDIIDNAHLRRGKPTMHKLLEKGAPTDKKAELGKNLAIIAGDIIYALAIEAFLSVKEDCRRKEKALQYFLETTTITALGEFIDTIQGIQPLNKIREKDVFLNYSLKTARYSFNSPLVTGALLAGAPQKELKKLSQLSLTIGHAFQIQDDIIGIFDSEKRIGKSILSDIQEAKKTLLVCHAYHHLKKKNRQDFIKTFTKTPLAFKDLLCIRKIFIEAGSLGYCVGQVEANFNQTLRILKKLQLKPSSKTAIIDNFIKLFYPTGRIAKKYKIPLQLDT